MSTSTFTAELRTVLEAVLALGSESCYNNGRATCVSDKMEEIITPFWQKHRESPEARVLINSTDDDGRSCPVPYVHYTAKKLLAALGSNG